MKSVKKSPMKKRIIKSINMAEPVEEPLDEPPEEPAEEPPEEPGEEPGEEPEEETDINLNTEDVIDIAEPAFLKDNAAIPIIIDPANKTAKNKMTIFELVRIKGERMAQLIQGAKPLIKKNNQSEELTYAEIALEEIKTNMIPFKIKRFVKDHYEIWEIGELDKKHLESYFQ